MFDAIAKYRISVTVSTIVVINGDAITAGSKPIFFAPIGRIVPINFANITAKKAVRLTIIAIYKLFCTYSSCSYRKENINEEM